jgi:hypothetical protein
MVGPVVPIGPALERELALVFEAHREPAELAAAIAAFAFERGLVFRTTLRDDVVLLPVSRAGDARAVRIVERPAPRPNAPKRGPEWTAAMPARRK